MTSWRRNPARHRWGCDLALVSNPRWRESQPAGKPPNWSLVLTGSERGAVAFTDRERAP
jgi:hypothetical protein